MIKVSEVRSSVRVVEIDDDFEIDDVLELVDNVDFGRSQTNGRAS